MPRTDGGRGGAIVLTGRRPVVGRALGAPRAARSRAWTSGRRRDRPRRSRRPRRRPPSRSAPSRGSWPQASSPGARTQEPLVPALDQLLALDRCRPRAARRDRGGRRAGPVHRDAGGRADREVAGAGAGRPDRGDRVARRPRLRRSGTPAGDLRRDRRPAGRGLPRRCTDRCPAASLREGDLAVAPPDGLAAELCRPSRGGGAARRRRCHPVPAGARGGWAARSSSPRPRHATRRPRRWWSWPSRGSSARSTTGSTDVVPST